MPDTPPSPLPVSTTTAINPPNEAYGVFCGPIDQEAVRRFLYALAPATNPNNKVTHVHILFQTLGGNVGDGVCLYNFLRSFPIDLTIYNVGSVQSIGVIIFLGAKNKKTSENSTFLIHRTTTGASYAKSSTLKALSESIALDDHRTEAILRAHVNLSKKMWDDISDHDVTLSGKEAIKLGIADGIGEFSPPKGSQIYYI